MAISTTGDEHRLEGLTKCVRAWRRALPLGSTIVVTVDGDEDACARALAATDDIEGGRVGGTVYRVGQPRIYHPLWCAPNGPHPRLGVATNKNTGIELLMDAGVDHLFLSDDDCWPLYPASLTKHIEHHAAHSMVCWGASRLAGTLGADAWWKWPRGVLLYVERYAVETVGGMDEAFGPGGHEHAEWSRRIHNAGLTPAPFLSPASYAETGPSGKATRASALWHCEDMRRPGETQNALAQRRQAATSVRRNEGDWEHIRGVMASREGSSDFVPFQAQYNQRASATLCTNNPASLGAEESK